jgi:hypothetical protein
MAAKKLILVIEDDGQILFENLQEFKRVELMGVLHCALASADVIYKTKTMQTIKESIYDSLNKKEDEEIAKEEGQ